MIIHIDNRYENFSPYPLMMILGISVGLIGQFLINTRRGIRKSTALKLILIQPFTALLCSSVLTIILSCGKNIGNISIGGLIGMYLSVYIISNGNSKKIQREILLQDCTFLLPLMYSVLKFGCLFAGCCHGIEYNGFFCIQYSELDGPVFPVQLLESLCFFLIFLIGIFLYKRHNASSITIVFILSAVTKFLLDYLRESHENKIITANQILCLLLIASFIILKHVKKQNIAQLEKKSA